MADSTEATEEAIFDQAFVEEYAAHLESLYGDVAADLWNEEELKGYEAFLYEIVDLRRRRDALRANAENTAYSFSARHIARVQASEVTRAIRRPTATCE